VADKIAIYGGSFNPIHNAHLKVCVYAMKECQLDKVIFMPNANPPHKEKDLLVSAKHRYNMVKLAISDYPDFEISDYEMNKINPSYTIDTMRHMASQLGSYIYFIIGADSLYTLHKWKDYPDLIKECNFIVADRTCSEGSDIKKAADLINSQGGSVTVISMPKEDITSTYIRQCVKKGIDVSEFLPDKVNEYIQSNNLYKSNLED